MSHITPERFKQICFETPGVERYSFLSFKDIAKISGRARGTIRNDFWKRLIEPISNQSRIPLFDGIEVYAYLVRIGQIELPPQ